MAQSKSADSYNRVRLFKDGEGRQTSVHSMVMAAFVGPRPTPEHEINHKNSNRSDNRLRNLEYCTKLENMRHAFRNGRAIPPAQGLLHNSRLRPETVPRGERHGNAKLTEAAVQDIRTRYAAGGVSQPQLAREYGVTMRVIWMVIHRKTWKHVA